VLISDTVLDQASIDCRVVLMGKRAKKSVAHVPRASAIDDVNALKKAACNQIDQMWKMRRPDLSASAAPWPLEQGGASFTSALEP